MDACDSAVRRSQIVVTTIAVLSLVIGSAGAAEVDIVDVHRSYDLSALAYSQIEFAVSDSDHGESIDLGEWGCSASVESETKFNYYSWCESRVLAASHVANTGANFYGWTAYQYLGCGECGGHGSSFFRGSFDFDVTTPTRFDFTGSINGQYATAQLEHEGQVLFTELNEYGSSEWAREVLLDPGTYTFDFVAAAAETLMGTGGGDFTLQTTFDVHVRYSDPAVSAGEPMEQRTWAETKGFYR
jgi:hypothetical protein